MPFGSLTVLAGAGVADASAVAGESSPIAAAPASARACAFSRTITSCRDEEDGTTQGCRRFPEEIVRMFTGRQPAGILSNSSSSFSSVANKTQRDGSDQADANRASILCSEMGGISERGQGVKISWRNAAVCAGGQTMTGDGRGPRSRCRLGRSAACRAGGGEPVPKSCCQPRTRSSVQTRDLGPGWAAVRRARRRWRAACRGAASCWR
jgi:hypothetical protein